MSTVKLPPPIVLKGDGPASSPAQSGRAALPLPLPAEAEAPRTRVAPSEQPAGKPARADSPLFRHEALRAYQLGMGLSAPLRVLPLSSALLLSALATALLCAVLVASVGQVDLTARGRGVVRAVEGVSPLMLETEGVVREVLVRAGDVVEAGQILLRLESARLRAALMEAEQQLAAVTERSRRDDAQARSMYSHDTRLLERRARLTVARIESQNLSISAREQEHQRYAALVQDGLVADKTSRDSAQLLNQERRDWLTLNDELARVQQQRTALEQTYHAGMAQRAHELREALARRDAARLLLAQTELHAARAGRVESLVVAPGDVVAAGFVVARLVSLGNVRHVAAFLAERDRAFVRPNMQVRLEIDRLPVGEFGSAAARVVRVSSEIASQSEIERALGAAAPQGVHFAVDLQLGNDARTRSLFARAGSGTLLTVRMPLRRRRVISLIFDPIRKWLD